MATPDLSPPPVQELKPQLDDRLADKLNQRVTNIAQDILAGLALDYYEIGLKNSTPITVSNGLVVDADLMGVITKMCDSSFEDGYRRGAELTISWLSGYLLRTEDQIFDTDDLRMALELAAERTVS